MYPQKKHTTLFLLFTILSFQVAAQGPSLEELLEVGLPVVEINTVNGEEPTAELVSAPEGSWGAGVTNNTKVPGEVKVWLPDGTVAFNSGRFLEGFSGMKIKLRGNTSARSLKKAYKIKLQKKADMLCRNGSTNYKDKDWLLLREEQTSLNTPIGFWTNERLGASWTPAFKHVNLIFNNDFRGTYLLTESIKRNPSCRIDVDKETGLILEADAYWWNEPFFLKSLFSERQRLYTFKYPDEEDIKQETLESAQQQIEAMEESILNGTYPDFIDIQSSARWLLAHDILGTYDHGGSNIYLIKYSEQPDHKFQMATLWDFDTIERTEDTWAPIHIARSCFFWYLLVSPDSSFRDTYCHLWETEGRKVISDLLQRLRDFAASDEAQSLNKSRILDAKRWTTMEYHSVASDLEKTEKWFKSRLPWIDSQITALQIPVSIKDNIMPASTRDIDLQGRHILRSGSNRIIIRNGRKYAIPAHGF